MARTVDSAHSVYVDQDRHAEILDADLRPSEVAEILAGLRFSPNNGRRLISIDQGTRDYLLAALAARRGKA
jgi:hypothetical protein